MEILGTNEIGYKEPIKVDNKGHLIISGSTGGGSSAGSAIIPPTTTTGNISGVGAFAKTNGDNTYSPLNLDATGHLLVSASGIENVVLVQGKDGANQYDVKVDGTGQVATTNAILDECVASSVLATSNTYLDACVDDGGAHTATAVLDTRNTNAIIANDSSTSAATPVVCSTEGRLEVQVVGSADINGGAPHRHLTIDSQGRILTIPTMTSTNNAIAAAQTRKVQGYDTANTTYRDVAVDADGHLQVDVLSGGGSSSTPNAYTKLDTTLAAVAGTTAANALDCSQAKTALLNINFALTAIGRDIQLDYGHGDDGSQIFRVGKSIDITAQTLLQEFTFTPPPRWLRLYNGNITPQVPTAVGVEILLITTY